MSAPVAPSLSSAPRHLCDVPFRFGPDAPSSARPTHGEATALDRVLDALARGAGTVETRSGLRLRHAWRRPELAEAVAQHARDVRTWHELGLSGRGPDRAFDAWPARIRLYLTWLDRHVFPTARALDVRPGVRVADVARYRAALQDRLEAGPEADSAIGLVADLTRLYETHIEERQLDVPQRRLVARAA